MSDSFSLAGRSTLRQQLATLPKSPRLYAAVALGLLFGLFLYSYWLVDLFPVTSRLLLLLTVAAGVLGTAGAYLLLQRAARQFATLPGLGRIALLTVSLLCGAIILFGGTTGWLSPARSIPFLLPTHRLEVHATGATGNSGLALLWFNTSMGDVSYSTLRYSGWKRVGDLLVLQDPAQNSIVWTGRTGASAELVWRGSSADNLQLSWDWQVEKASPTSGKFTALHSFFVPWYASRTVVVVIGVLVFALLAATLGLLFWDRREALQPVLTEAFASTASRMDRLDALALAGAGVLALALRLPNLGTPYPPVDEYYHLIAARQIIDGAALSSVYQRSLWLVTLPVALSLRFFGASLWAARLPGVLFNVLAILPLYLLARKVNRPVAVLSVILYATSPWIVTFSRIAREYAYYPFYFFWTVLAMVVLIEQIPQGFVVLRDWKKVLRPKTILIALALMLPPFFAFLGDPLSTFRTILIAYLGLGVFLLARLDFSSRANWPFLGALALGMLLIAFAAYRDQNSFILLVPAFNPVPVSYFVPDPQQQWYYDRLVPVILLMLLAALACGALWRRRNFVPLFVFALYGGALAFFAFFSKTFFHTRHLLTTELWFVILMALGLYLLWKVVKALIPGRQRYANVLLVGVLALTLINWGQLVQPVISTNPNNAISEDYLHDMSQVQSFMLEHARPSDVLISTVYGLYSSWQEKPSFQAQYRISTESPADQVFALIAQHPSGWIIIDQIRLEASTLGPNAFAGNPDVEYIGLFGDENVWHWQHHAGDPGSLATPGKAEWIYPW